MKIQLANLQEGLTEIEFEHNSDSLNFTELDEIGYSFINPIKIKVSINKVGVQYFLKVITNTIANFICDRCLETFNHELHDEFRLVYSTEIEYWSEAKDEKGLRLLTSEATEINLADDIRESLLLMIPMKIICSEDCKGLCPQCGINLNFETCNHISKQIDPRWETLKKIHNSAD